MATITKNSKKIILQREAGGRQNKNSIAVFMRTKTEEANESRMFCRVFENKLNTICNSKPDHFQQKTTIW